MSGALNIAALVVIMLLICLLATVIVQLGTLPGKIARKRNHPQADAVDAASWIGLALGVFWPLAFIWAFYSTPARDDELTKLRARLDVLEKASADGGSSS
jgi:hypothetical protein